jgi:putative addiction module component (TIGR02574 family)
MSLTEILAAIPRLSFAERQQLIRRATEGEDEELTSEEQMILDQRLKDFRPDQESGISADELKESVMQRLKPQ